MNEIDKRAEGESAGTRMAAPTPRRVHVTLVRPPLIVSRWSYAGTLTPPLGLSYIAAALEADGHAVTVIDAIGEDPERVTPVFDRYLALGLPVEDIVSQVPRETEVIGVTCMFSSDWPYTRRIISALRTRCADALIVAGGEHVTATPLQTLRSVPELDCLVVGEGEETASELLRAVADRRCWRSIDGVGYRDETGAPKVSRRSRIRSIDTIARPVWHLVPIENYVRHQISFGLRRGVSMPVLASRGCPFECTFCSNPEMWTTRWSSRNPELLLDEIEHYMRAYGATNFDFYDLTAIVNRRWILDFTAAIKRRGLKFSWQLPSGTRSEAIDGEVARALVGAGCVYLAYSPESGSPRLLKVVKKKVKLQKMITSMRESVAAGMVVKANMIIGLPGETVADVLRSLSLIARMAILGVSDVSIAPFAPYPGSELFDQLDREADGQMSTDDFYLQLSAQTDLTQNHAWNPHMSPTQIALFRVVGHALFYTLAMLRRPFRIVTTIRNVATEREATVLEKSVRGFIRRQLNRGSHTASARAGH